MMFRKTPLVFVCFLLTVEAFAQSAGLTASEISGTYSVADSYVSHNITLKADLTYSAISTTDVCELSSAGSEECLNYPLESGTFSMAGNIVKFNPQTYRRYDQGKLINTLPPAYEFLLIKWSERFYLVRKDELKRFAEAVNMKFEPRKNGFAMQWNYFLLRSEGLEKPVNGLPDLPDGWNDFLLKKPVTAKVLKIIRRDGETLAVIDKGSRDGLKVGIQMLISFPDGSEIISVTESKATIKLKSDYLKAGAIMRTYFDWNNWFLDAFPAKKK